MGAKETVTKTTEENCHNTLEERLSEQKEISFKAGMKEVVEFAETNVLNIKGMAFQKNAFTLTYKTRHYLFLLIPK